MTALQDEPIFAIGGKTWRARGRMTDDGFVIFAGSTVNKMNESFKKDHYYPMRLQLETEGVISNGLVTRDYCFHSAGQAGSVVACRLISTNSEWKTDDEYEDTWGELHPKVVKAYEAVKSKKSVVKERPSAFRCKEGTNLSHDGVRIFFRTNPDGSTVERRGRCW